MVMNYEVPQIELDPPYSSDFLAHLHAGSYDRDLGIGIIWQRAMADPVANMFIDALDQVQAAVRSHRLNGVT
jgi:hypothetical protein